jgi:alkaline phosphatase
MIGATCARPFPFVAAALLAASAALFPGPSPAAAAPPVPVAPGASIDPGTPKNVILFVVDGMGFNYIDAASMYAEGRSRYQIEGPPGNVRRVAQLPSPTWAYERFPHQFAMSTCTALGSYDPEAAWGDFRHVIGHEGEPATVTGSAAAATSLSSGVKAIDPAVGLDANGEPVQHLARRALELGKAAGVIANVPFNHATPAGFLAHNEDRTNYHEIAREMILQSGANVIMGTGHPHYDDDGRRRESPRFFWMPRDVWNAVEAGETPYTLVDERSAFLELATGPTPEYVLGIPRAFTALQFNRDPNPLARPFREGPPGRVPPDEAPFEVPLNEHLPSLAEMTAAGLNTLANASDQGFFVMIEGGAADWGGHWNLLGRAIEDMLFLNEAVDVAVEWVERESSWDETLIIVTSDHETGYLTGPGSDPDWTPLVNEGAGRLPGHQWNHVYHTNTLVPLFAKGPGAERFADYAKGNHDPVWGPYVDNTDVANLVFELWGRDGPLAGDRAAAPAGDQGVPSVRSGGQTPGCSRQ